MRTFSSMIQINLHSTFYNFQKQKKTLEISPKMSVIRFHLRFQ